MNRWEAATTIVYLARFASLPDENSTKSRVPRAKWPSLARTLSPSILFERATDLPNRSSRNGSPAQAPGQMWLCDVPARLSLTERKTRQVVSLQQSAGGWPVDLLTSRQAECTIGQWSASTQSVSQSLHVYEWPLVASSAAAAAAIILVPVHLSRRATGALLTTTCYASGFIGCARRQVGSLLM